jgi:uncharacterized protein (TIGR00369 family)
MNAHSSVAAVSAVAAVAAVAPRPAPGGETSVAPRPAPGGETAVEARERRYRWADPALVQTRASSRTGLEILAEFAAGELPKPPVGSTFDMELLDFAHGRVVIGLPPREWQYNPLGTVSGGVCAVLIDSALGLAVHSTLGAGDFFATLELSVRYLRPVTVASGLLRCEASVVSAGRKTATATATVHDAADRLVSTGTTTYLLMRHE